MHKAKKVFSLSGSKLHIVAFNNKFDPNTIYKEEALLDKIKVSFGAKKKLSPSISAFIKKFKLTSSECFLLSRVIGAKTSLVELGKRMCFLSAAKILRASQGAFKSEDTIRRAKRKLEKAGLLITKNDLSKKKCIHHGSKLYKDKALPNNTTWYYLPEEVYAQFDLKALRKGLLNYAFSKLKRLKKAFDLKFLGENMQKVKTKVLERIKKSIIYKRFMDFGRLLKYLPKKFSGTNISSYKYKKQRSYLNKEKGSYQHFRSRKSSLGYRNFTYERFEEEKRLEEAKRYEKDLQDMKNKPKAISNILFSLLPSLKI